MVFGGGARRTIETARMGTGWTPWGARRGQRGLCAEALTEAAFEHDYLLGAAELELGQTIEGASAIGVDGVVGADRQRHVGVVEGVIQLLERLLQIEGHVGLVQEEVRVARHAPREGVQRHGHVLPLGGQRAVFSSSLLERPLMSWFGAPVRDSTYLSTYLP
jgi:hypothetical protein